MAALVVVVWHFLLAFDQPWLSETGHGFFGTPLFAFVHGSAAVGVFFVLSAYVLTARYFETGQRRILIIGALKRWFRLFLPVFLSVMMSWLLFHFHLYPYEDAAKISHSGWLMTFGLSMNPPFDPTFLAALQEGLIIAFYHNNNSFNPLLWTIHIEFIGSYIAFAFAALLAGLRGQPRLVALITLIAGLSVHFIEPLMIPFVPGTLLAFYAPKLRPLKIPAALALIVAGLAFLGYREPVGFYGWLEFLEPINGDPLRAYTGAIGAVFIMMAFIGCEPLRQKLKGPLARILGQMSFPLYLVHLILIFSLGSAVFARAAEGNSYGTAMIITALILLPVILAVTAVFAIVDIKWVAFVNAVFRKISIAG